MEIRLTVKDKGIEHKIKAKFNNDDLGNIIIVNGSLRDVTIRDIRFIDASMVKLFTKRSEFYDLNLKILIRTAYSRTVTRDLATTMLRTYDIDYDDTIDYKDVSILEIAYTDYVKAKSSKVFTLVHNHPTSSGYFTNIQNNSDLMSKEEMKYNEAFEKLLISK